MRASHSLQSRLISTVLAGPPRRGTHPPHPSQSRARLDRRVASKPQPPAPLACRLATANARTRHWDGAVTQAFWRADGVHRNVHRHRHRLMQADGGRHARRNRKQNGPWNSRCRARNPINPKHDPIARGGFGRRPAPPVYGTHHRRESLLPSRSANQHARPAKDTPYSQQQNLVALFGRIPIWPVSGVHLPCSLFLTRYWSGCAASTISALQCDGESRNGFLELVPRHVFCRARSLALGPCDVRCARRSSWDAISIACPGCTTIHPLAAAGSGCKPLDRLTQPPGPVPSQIPHFRGAQS